MLIDLYFGLQIKFNRETGKFEAGQFSNTNYHELRRQIRINIKHKYDDLELRDSYGNVVRTGSFDETGNVFDSNGNVINPNYMYYNDQRVGEILNSIRTCEFEINRLKAELERYKFKIK